MAQFEVYRNPNPDTHAQYPYLVDIQHDNLTTLTSRLVIPLCVATTLQSNDLEPLTPRIDFQGVPLLLLTPQLAAMPARLLSDPIGTVAHLRREIIAALDFAVTGF